MKSVFITLFLCWITASGWGQTRKRAREYGINIGVLPTGALNAITDVKGVKVGHTTLIREQHVRTGVTAILPHGDNLFGQKVPAAVYVGNGFGKLAGSTQVQEPGNENVQSVNAVVGETNDGYLNDIRGRHVTAVHVRELKQYYLSKALSGSADGSCMIVVATDAPVDARNLERMARRAMMGLAKTGGIAANGSGDYVIAFSAHPGLRVPHTAGEKTQTMTLLRNDEMSSLFMAVIEATEEAILNSLTKAETLAGREGHVVEALPLDRVLKILKRYKVVK